ncbi:hypothetical protein ACGF8B_40745 [Streptomyces sp. NPDC047917]|uniref:hypothetical protein n=1 Tax=Streptomyces sp. NPDC047917 TaxID=3365491 RepID=UPI00371668F4
MRGRGWSSVGAGRTSTSCGFRRSVWTPSSRLPTAGTHEKGKFGAAILYITHGPEMTDVYAGLGCTLSPDGIGIPTPLGFICHGPIKGFCFSVKPLRTGVQMQAMPTPYGRQLVIRGILPGPAH